MVSLVSWGLSTEATRLAFQATITFLLYLMCQRISLICARLNEQQRKPGITPLAGSAKMDAGASLPQASAASDDHAWMPSPARGFSVRGPTYHRDGRKVPSAVAFGRVVAMDTLRCPRKPMHLLQHGLIRLPAGSSDWREPYAEWLVVVQMLPMRMRHTLFTSAATDGDTFCLVTYVRLSPGIAAAYDGDAPPRGAAEVLKRFLLRAYRDEGVADALKEIGLVANLDAAAKLLLRPVAALLRRFNGKPVLTRPQHVFFRGEVFGERYLEIDLDGHQFSYGTRSAINKVLRSASLRRRELGYDWPGGGTFSEASRSLPVGSSSTTACSSRRAAGTTCRSAGVPSRNLLGRPPCRRAARSRCQSSSSAAAGCCASSRRGRSTSRREPSLRPRVAARRARGAAATAAGAAGLAGWWRRGCADLERAPLLSRGTPGVSCRREAQTECVCRRVKTTVSRLGLVDTSAKKRQKTDTPRRKAKGAARSG